MYGEGGDDLVGGGAGQRPPRRRAGPDALRCEGGADTAWTDGADRLRGCETVHRD